MFGHLIHCSVTAQNVVDFCIQSIFCHMSQTIKKCGEGHEKGREDVKMAIFHIFVQFVQFFYFPKRSKSFDCRVFPSSQWFLVMSFQELSVSVYLFNGISTFLGYSMPKLCLKKNSCGTIQPIAGEKVVQLIFFYYNYNSLSFFLKNITLVSL